MFRVIALITALCIAYASAADARGRIGGDLNPQGPTGQNGNSSPNFTGYKWGFCTGTVGCISASQTNVVPVSQLDTGGTGCPGNLCAYVWSGITTGLGFNLAQQGFTIEVSGGVANVHRAWWECLGVNNVQFTFDAGATLSINDGDTVTSTTTCTNCTVGSAPPATPAWNFTVNDVTKGQSVTKTGFNCPMTNDAFYQAYWVAETNNTSFVNFGTLNFSSVTVNGGNPNLVQGLHVRCTAPTTLPCALYEFTTGTGATGTTINPSIPNATKDGFNLCVNSNGKRNYNGTTNYAQCAAPP